MSEINLTAYQDDGYFGKKYIAEQRKWIDEFEANPDDGQHNCCDASDFSGLLGEALDEIERLQSQLSARDALIERLVEAGEDRDGILIHSHGYSSAMYVWQKIVAEWKASKDGGVR